MLITVLELLVYMYVLFRTGEAESCNVNFQSDLATRTECFTTFGACGFESLQSRLPTLYNKTGWRRDPPRNMKLTSFCEPDNLGVNHSGINVEWNLPNSQSATGIAGYELRMEGDPLNFRCLVVILEEKATPQNIHLVLNSTMYPVRRNRNYMIVLHSLPRANNSEPESKLVLSMNCKRGSTSSKWSPAGHNYTYLWPEKTLIVWFPAPPLPFNITRFQLDLFTADSGKTQKISNKTEVRFTDVEPGNYTLYMQPYNEHPTKKDLCVCKDDENRCDTCKLSRWYINVKVPKKLSPTSAGLSEEIAVGAAVAAVVLAIVMFLLYTYLARHFGIECVIGKSNKKGKDNSLHVLCVDTYSTGQGASKLQTLLEKELNAQMKFHRSMLVPHDEFSSKMTLLWTKWSDKTLVNDVTDNGARILPEVATNILICVLLSGDFQENISEMLSKVHTTIPKRGPLRVHICAVTFENTSETFQSDSVKCYALNTDQQKFITAVKTAFPEQTNYHETKVIYTCKDMKSTNGLIRPTDKSNVDSNRYVALTKSKQTEHPRKGQTNAHASNCPIPEITYLGASEQRRERYVSNDSGHGGSVVSYKPGHSPDDLSVLWQDSNMIPSEMDCKDFQIEAKNGDTHNILHGHMDCPSCDLSFFPPDPSVISENDFDDNLTDYNVGELRNCNIHQRQSLHDRKNLNCMNALTKTNANSMDSLMDEMAQINERSAVIMQQDPNPGEVQSVWEGHV